MSTLEIKDLGPIENMVLDMTGPVVLIHGPHGSGKSTVANALTLALYGETSRLRLKRDLYQMIRAGAEKAAIVFKTESHTLRRTISEAGTRGTRAVASDLDKIRMRYPWEALTQKPSVWKTMLGSVGLPKDKLREVLADLPIAHEALERAATTLEDTVANFEAWRLDLHRSKCTAPKLPDTLDVNGTAVSISEYLPHEEHYRTRRQDLMTEISGITETHNAVLRDYQNKAQPRASARARWHEFAVVHNMDPDDTQREVKVARLIADASQLVEQLQARIGALEANLVKKTRVCETCGQDWPDPETKSLDRQIDGAKGALHLQSFAVEAGKATLRDLKALREELQMPEAPDITGKNEEIRGLDAILMAINSYNAAKAHAKDVVKTNEEASQARKQVQTAIERLRDPHIATELAGNTAMTKVRQILSHSCGLLCLPEIVLSEGLVPLVVMSDGSQRDIGLLSDTQRALAGMALSEAFARVQGVQVLIVDQVDWVHGKYVENLVSYLVATINYYDTALVLTSSEEVKGEVTHSMRGMCYGLKDGSVATSFPFKPDLD